MLEDFRDSYHGAHPGNEDRRAEGLIVRYDSAGRIGTGRHGLTQLIGGVAERSPARCAPI